ncbi:hypothetical protein PSY81_23800, partial [Shigella flexneri]|nr:hypothetical protein [Shigella flexneri]
TARIKSMIVKRDKSIVICPSYDNAFIPFHYHTLYPCFDSARIKGMIVKRDKSIVTIIPFILAESKQQQG